MARCYLSRSVAGQVSGRDTVEVSDASHCLQVFRNLIEARGGGRMIDVGRANGCMPVHPYPGVLVSGDCRACRRSKSMPW